MKGVPGRATSLVSVGLLIALSVLVAAVSAMPGAGSGGRGTGSALLTPAQAHRGTGAQSHGASGPTKPKTTVSKTVSQTFRCMYPQRSGGSAPRGIPQLTSLESGVPQVTATTFCRNSSWFVSLRVGAHVSAPFEVPDDPPIPPFVTVQRFVTLFSGSIPAVLVQRDEFGSAAIYELFTSTGVHVSPVRLLPGGSPVLLLKASSLLDGAGFTCTFSSSGEVIRQFEWYIINATTLRVSAHGDILGDPEAYLETTVYKAVSPDAFTSTTDTIVPVGYTTVANVGSDSC